MNTTSTIRKQPQPSQVSDDVFVFDFETEAIGPRPNEYPPKPVGLAYMVILPDGRKLGPEYLNWDHSDAGPEAEQSYDAAHNLLHHHFTNGSLLVAHNARFDIEVACKHFDLPEPDWMNVRDTLAYAAVAVPEAKSLSLKPLAEWLLDMAPDEQSAVHQWLIDHKIVTKTQKNWGAFISKAPGEVVGPYAVGDVTRTAKLLTVLKGRLPENARGPVELEHRLSPILMDAERRGVRVDRAMMGHMHGICTDGLEKDDAEIQRLLNAPGLNVDANEDLADALEAAGAVKAGFPKTPTGKRSTSKEAIELAVDDPDLKDLLKLRGATATLIRTFLEPWEEMSRPDGRIHPSWNSLRGDAGGTRTGRLSCSNPNLQNVPKQLHPSLPNPRTLLLPEEGHLWVSGDFNSQELRVLAHFAGGELERLFNADPDLDLHTTAAMLISEKINRPVMRKQTKTVAFALIYGAGNEKLAKQLAVSPDEAAQIRKAYFDVLPGVRELLIDITARAAKGKCVRTLGGRMLPAPKDEFGRSKDYALVNYLIQGSAADQTKATIVAWEQVKNVSDLFLTTVHDEINISVREEQVEFGVYWLKKAMEQPTLSVPSRATVVYGPAWSHLEFK